MTAQVRVILGEARGVLVIPMSALSPPGMDGERTVEVAGDGGALERRPVVVGLNDKVQCEIKSGLEAGERVVTGHRSADPKTSSLPAPPVGL